MTGGELPPSETGIRAERLLGGRRSAGTRPAAELYVRPGGRPQGGEEFGAGHFFQCR